MRKKQISKGIRTFNIFNFLGLSLLSIICIMPIINVLAVSFSSKFATETNAVKLWPVGFTTEAYNMVLYNQPFINSFGISIARVIVGVSIGILVTVLASYPLSLEKEQFKARNFFMWVFIIPMLFSGGLIPLFMQVKKVGLIDNFWSLILPITVQIYFVIVMMSFFKSIPSSIYEAAKIDGAGHWTILWKIYISLSLPSIATVVLFIAILHWNDFFYGAIYMNDMKKWPVQTFLYYQQVSINFNALTPEDVIRMSKLSNRSFKAAQTFLATIPILLMYLFLQKYFVTGLTIGSVKE